MAQPLLYQVAMKILIAYDGSHGAEAALDDIARCGLPPSGDALVVTVAEVWLPPPDSREPENEFLEEVVARHRQKGERLLNEAGVMAKHAADRVRASLPHWNVSQVLTYGSPAWEILNAADGFNPDLVIMGSHGHSAIGRLILGSTSQKMLTEAPCSVRIARGKVEVDPAPGRVVIGFDGSRGANAAVETVRSRQWPKGTEIRLIAASCSVVPAEIARFTPSVAYWADAESRKEYRWIEHLLGETARLLETDDRVVQYQVIEGNPHDILVSEAENWHADCIFVGANEMGSRLERFLLGSTSAAVAARAGCSVEIVRIPA